jgi:GT2 family glycosyltransferase/glycosyltransferase involved in cell wall biosynthesis
MLWHPAGPPATVDELHRRAVSLVRRACALDEQVARLELENEQLQARLAGQPVQPHATGTAAFEPPAIAHAWPMALDPGRDPASLDPYDHRVDDPAILAARDGEAFLRRFALRGRAPRHAAAARAIAEAGRLLPAAPEGTRPDTSIIIPVHGQLSWTLNCLHALLSHTAAMTAEVIVVDDASPDATAAAVSGIAAAIPGLRLLRLRANAGFIAACNQAADSARGKLLVLLNNDTRVAAGWLDTLADSLDVLPRAGLVGSKLFYPDGRLQEAGGIVWRDGTAWNYGRDDDPNRPHYTHAREVDYVSGAAIALPVELWRALGGFDPRYAPAYAEDADLALRIRALGRAVWLQPQSRVVHYEGMTSGTDPNAGAKAHQATNQRRLFLRWHGALEAHRRNGDSPYLERERGAHRRALIIDATTPTPAQDAGSVTTMQTLRLFQALGYKPYFMPQDNFLYQPAHTPALLRDGIECAYAPYERDVESYLTRLGELFDVVLVYRVGVMRLVLPALRRHAPRAPVLFHIMDLHHQRMAREAELRGDAALHRAAAEMRAHELALIGQADCTIVHSTTEAALIAAAQPHAAMIVWPFMFPCHGTETGFRQREGFCFLGGYAHPPNTDAALFFAADVLPLLRARLPSARLVVAGANPGPEIRALAGPDIEVAGFVADLRPLFDAARVFVSPLRYGAGVKGKITAAMAYGLPVVTTACGAEGMELRDGEDVLIADTPDALADACLRLHGDEALWTRLSARGLEIVRTRHSLDLGRQRLEQAIETGLARRLGLPVG